MGFASAMTKSNEEFKKPILYSLPMSKSKKKVQYVQNKNSKAHVVNNNSTSVHPFPTVVPQQAHTQSSVEILNNDVNISDFIAKSRHIKKIYITGVVEQDIRIERNIKVVFEGTLNGNITVASPATIVKISNANIITDKTAIICESGSVSVTDSIITSNSTGESVVFKAIGGGNLKVEDTVVKHINVRGNFCQTVSGGRIWLDRCTIGIVSEEYGFISGDNIRIVNCDIEMNCKSLVVGTGKSGSYISDYKIVSDILEFRRSDYMFIGCQVSSKSKHYVDTVNDGNLWYRKDDESTEQVTGGNPNCTTTGS